MFRYNGVSLPGCGLAIFFAILFAISRNFSAWCASVSWLHAGLVLLGLWIVIDIASAISVHRMKKAEAGETPETGEKPSPR